MARRRFFVDAVRNHRAEITGDDARHLTRVLRVEVGQRYEISDNRRLWLAEIEMARKERVVFRAIETIEAEPLPVRLALLAALVKFDSFEWMLEKATELGVEEIVPVVAMRSERGLERAAGKRLARWRRIVFEASQQSRRAHLPEVREPVAFAAALARHATCRYVLDEAGAPPLARLFPQTRAGSDLVVLLTGPEGGWSDEERAGFAPAGWCAASLGPTILRTETAAVAALAIVSAAWHLQ